MRMRNYLTSATFALAVGSVACAPMASHTNAGGMATERTTMLVENNNWADMTVYILRDGVRTRLGAVPSMSRSTFVLSNAMLAGTGELRVMADPLGSPHKWTSQPILLNPGNQVRFRLENNVSLSTYSVY
ncbi:MAG: hypothetical protein WEE89_02560 [Gemmatimonadota bacterium]